MKTSTLLRHTTTGTVLVFSAAAFAQQTANMTSSSSGSGGAIAACNGKQVGAQSSYIDNNGVRISGMCEMIAGKLALRSATAPSPAPAPGAAPGSIATRR